MAKGFKPGVSGNPKGRPKKGKTITDALKKYLEEKDKGSDITRKQQLIQSIYSLAVDEGDFMALKYIIDRIDGKPVESKEISGPGGSPVELYVSKDFIPEVIEDEDEEKEDTDDE